MKNNKITKSLAWLNITTLLINTLVVSVILPFSGNFVKPVQAQGIAQAQESSIVRDEEYENWARTMRAFGIYPQPEGDDIILYDYETYHKNFCPGGCLFSQHPPEAILSSVQEDLELIFDLRSRLNGACYNEDEILRDYFPETESLTFFPINLQKPGYCLEEGIKDEIDRESLVKFIQQIFLERGIQKENIASFKNDPFRVAATGLDEIFSISSMVKILQGKVVSDEELVNGVLGFTLFWGMYSKLLAKGLATAEFELALKGMSADTKVIKNAIINDKQQISLKSVQDLALGEKKCATTFACAPQRSWVIERAHKSPLRGLPSKPPRSSLRKIDTTGLARSEVGLVQEIASNRGYIISTNYLETFFKDYQTRLLDLFASEGRTLNKDWASLFEGFNKGWALVAPGSYVRNKSGKNLGGFAHGRVLVVADNAGSLYSSIGVDGFKYILGHEGEHVFSGHTASTLTGMTRSQYYIYNQDTNTKLGLFLSRGYEFGTDLTFEKVYGVSLNWGYKDQFIRAFNYDIKGLWQRFKFESNGILRDIDLIEFSATADDERFLGKIMDSVGKERVRAILNSDRRMDRLTLAWDNWHKRIGTPSRYPNNDKSYQPNRMPWWVPVGIGGGAAYLSFVFAKRAGAEELPADLVIDYDSGPDPELDYPISDDGVEVTIIQACDKLQPGEECQVDTIITQDGNVVDGDEYTTTVAVVPEGQDTEVNACMLKDQAFDCGDGRKCLSEEYDSGDPNLKCYNDYFLDENSCSKEVKTNPDGNHFHCDSVQSFKLPDFKVKAAFAQEDSQQLPLSIEQITPLEGGQDCNEKCIVTIPANLALGSYKIVVFLTRKDSKQIIDSDSAALSVSNASADALYDEQIQPEKDYYEGSGCELIDGANHSIWGIWSPDGVNLRERKDDFGVVAGECGNPLDQSGQDQPAPPSESQGKPCENASYTDPNADPEVYPNQCIRKYAPDKQFNCTDEDYLFVPC